MPKLPSREARVIWRKLDCLNPMFVGCQWELPVHVNQDCRLSRVAEVGKF